jgi:hypothetical protein
MKPSLALLFLGPGLGAHFLLVVVSLHLAGSSLTLVLLFIFHLGALHKTLLGAISQFQNLKLYLKCWFISG